LAKKKSKTLIVFLKISVSFTFLFFVLKKAGVQDVLLTLKSLNIVYFFTAVLIYVMCLFVSSIRWRLLLSFSEANRISSTFRLFALYLIGSFFNMLLPGIVGGDAVRIYYLYKDTKESSISLGSVFADRYIGFIGLISLGLIAVPFALNKVRGTGVEWFIPVVAIAFILGSYILFGLRFGKRFATIRGFYEYFLQLKKNPRIILKTYIMSVFIQVMVVLSVYIISKGLGVNTLLLEFFIFVPIIITVTSIPISISGIGLREGAFVTLLGLTGIEPDIATSISLAWFFVYVVGSLPGVVFYLRWRKKGELKEIEIET
jgi:uncharacterized membrane protein YbhN (UPF0104 family)